MDDRLLSAEEFSPTQAVFAGLRGELALLRVLAREVHLADELLPLRPALDPMLSTDLLEHGRAYAKQGCAVALANI